MRKYTYQDLLTMLISNVNAKGHHYLYPKIAIRSIENQLLSEYQIPYPIYKSQCFNAECVKAFREKMKGV